MLRKLTHTNEPIRLPLLADSATADAQFQAARLDVNKELDSSESENFAEEILRLVKATVGDSQALEVMKGLELAAVAMIDKKIRPKQVEKALANLRETMQKHDSREAIAYVRAQLAIQKYRETSDVEDLLVQEPEGTAFVTVRALTADERRAAERRAGHKPRHGALLASRAYDVLRRDSREGGDGNAAYAAHVAEMSDEEQAALEEFELWSIRVDREVARAGVISIDGFDIERSEHGYDVDGFLLQCVEGEEVISEAARHIRNVATLGKSENFWRSSESGTDESEDAGPVSVTDGSVHNASTVEEPHQSQES